MDIQGMNGPVLTYVALKVIECFRDAQLDSAYINDKMQEFSGMNNYEALHKALRILDDGNMIRLAEKLGVSVSDLNTTLLVLNNI